MNRNLLVAGIGILSCATFPLVLATNTSTASNVDASQSCEINIAVGPEILGGSLGWSSSYSLITLSATNSQCKDSDFVLVARTEKKVTLSSINVHTKTLAPMRVFSTVQLHVLTRMSLNYSSTPVVAGGCSESAPQKISLAILKNDEEIASKETLFLDRDCPIGFKSVSLSLLEYN